MLRYLLLVIPMACVAGWTEDNYFQIRLHSKRNQFIDTEDQGLYEELRTLLNHHQIELPSALPHLLLYGSFDEDLRDNILCSLFPPERASWQVYVDEQLEGAGKISAGAISGLDGNTRAASSGFQLK